MSRDWRHSARAMYGGKSICGPGAQSFSLASHAVRPELYSCPSTKAHPISPSTHHQSRERQRISRRRIHITLTMFRTALRSSSRAIAAASVSSRVGVVSSTSHPLPDHHRPSPMPSIQSQSMLTSLVYTEPRRPGRRQLCPRLCRSQGLTNRGLLHSRAAHSWCARRVFPC